jgi:hypothetical protein
MRRMATGLITLGLVLGLTHAWGAQGDEVNSIIDKAIQAHGLKGKEDKSYGFRGKNKGVLHVGGMDLGFTQDVAVQTPDKFKESMDLDVNNMKITVVSVFDGKQGWMNAAGNEIKVEGEILDEFKEASHMIRLSQGLFLKDKTLKFSLLGEATVNGKPALGIKVSKEGKKDLDFYFDKATGLLAKIERRVKDLQTGQEAAEERIITEYQDLDGRKIGKKVEVKRDGMPFMEAEVIEAKFVDRIDDGEFVRPN